jgi:hypothetical protein
MVDPGKVDVSTRVNVCCGNVDVSTRVKVCCGNVDVSVRTRVDIWTEMRVVWYVEVSVRIKVRF